MAVSALRIYLEILNLLSEIIPILKFLSLLNNTLFIITFTMFINYFFNIPKRKLINIPVILFITIMPILNLLFFRSIDKHYIRSEINLLIIGPAWFLTLPGEIYPEIVNGGIVNPEGADYPGKPLEVSPVREQMRGEYNFIVGLANDYIGYFIPKTQWDKQRPYAYEENKDPGGGESGSAGPDAAYTVFIEIRRIIEEYVSLFPSE